MQLQELYNKLNYLETQKQNIEHEIIETKKLIEKLSPFTKSQKIALFKSLFIAREDVYAKYWINKEGTKKAIEKDLQLVFNAKPIKVVFNNLCQYRVITKIVS